MSKVRFTTFTKATDSNHYERRDRMIEFGAAIALLVAAAIKQGDRHILVQHTISGDFTVRDYTPITGKPSDKVYLVMTEYPWQYEEAAEIFARELGTVGNMNWETVGKVRQTKIHPQKLGS